MAEEIVINKQTFFDRLSTFYTAWKSDKRAGDVSFGGAASIVIVAGKAEEAGTYQKNNALHFWLLGYEFPATLMVFTTESVWIVTTAKKAKHLEGLKNGKIPLELLVVSKDPESKTKAFEKCLDVIKGAGKKVGTLMKSEVSGPFADDWKKAFGDISKEVEEIDIAPALSLAAFSVKDETELRSMRTASRACSGIMADYWVDEMAEILDEGKKATHTSLTQKLDGKIDDKKFFDKVGKMGNDFDVQQLEWVYGPTIQSGSKYDLKLTATSDAENLYTGPGVIITGLGLRYKTYCSVVARSYLVDPTKSQSSTYRLVLSIHETVMKEVRDGAVIKDVYNKALGVLKAKKPELEKYFVKSVGSGIGIELRDQNLQLNAKNTRALRDGMTLTITTGFADIPNPDSRSKKDQVYSLILTDTIRVGPTESAVFTKDTPSTLDQIEFSFKDDADDAEPKKEKDKGKASRASAIATANIRKTKLRSEKKAGPDEGAESRRREHQKELAAKKQREGLDRYAEETGDQNGVAQKKFKRFESYKRDNQLPQRVKDMIVLVDPKTATVILPIMGRPVPFHINTIKSVSKSDEGEYAHLRFNFLSPGQGVGRKDDQPFEDPQAHFVRSLTIRSKDTDRIADINTQINDMRKVAARKEQEKKEMEDVVEQEKLVEIRNRRPIKLSDVYLRPALDGKRVPGEVEIHQNGLRYHSPLRNEHVDIVFSNVKHLFFQPCVGELIVIIHVHLRNPIMIGKKKTKDVQFFREATDMAADETGNRKRKHRFGDEEEFEAEQEERRRRAELDRQFKAFAERISDAGREEEVSVDVPFRDLSFHGVPNRSNVLISPATDALVQLTEQPFTVITLAEIEVAHLERIQFGLKNFDLVFVYKDFSRPPAHVNTIPVESLDEVKDWLNSVDIAYTEGPLNLNWGTIMKTVTADPHTFFAEGGWNFLSTNSDSEDSDDEDEESAFEGSDSELAADEESSDEESDFDDDASAEASEEAGSDDEVSAGKDWDELEKKAKRSDRETAMDDEEDKGKKRKR